MTEDPHEEREPKEGPPEPEASGDEVHRRRFLLSGLAAAGAVAAGPATDASASPEEAASRKADTAKLGRSNTFTVGPQTVEPGGAEDGLLVRGERDHIGDAVRTTRRAGPRGRQEETTFRIDSQGVAHFTRPVDLPPGQFRPPLGGWSGDSQMSSPAHHEHFNPVVAGDIVQQVSNYQLWHGHFYDLGDAWGSPGRIHFTTVPTPSGASLTGVLFFSGEDGMAGCRHMWVALYDYSIAPAAALVAQAPDEPAASWPPFTERYFPFPAPVTMPDPVNVAVALMIDADQPPSLMGFQQHNRYMDPHWGIEPWAYAFWGKQGGLGPTAPAMEQRELSNAVVGDWMAVPYMRVEFSGGK